MAVSGSRGAPQITLWRSSSTNAGVPELDVTQRAVLAHDAAVVRVLGGPGTGTTTTAVELVVDQVRRRGGVADRCLLLTPTRQGAADLRSRVTSRLGGTTTQVVARSHQAFGFAVLRAQAALLQQPAPRLLSGPEQDVVLRELLAGHAADGTGPAWPPTLQAALVTRGFRAELRDLLMRAVELGLDADGLAALGRQAGRAEWVAAAAVLREYDEVTALSRPGAYDPAWVLAAAADLLEDDPDALARLRSELDLLVVDDAQELTRPAARLLSLLAGPPLRLVLLGDPDAAVHTFRGADPTLLVGPWPAFEPVPTVVLRSAHRQGAALREVAQRVVTRIGAVGGGAQRTATALGPAGHVEVALLRAVAQEAAHVAGALREAHLRDGMPWGDMAVLVRGQGRAATLRRVLDAGGVPVAPASATLPVREEVAVRPLLTLLELSLALARDPAALPEPQVAEDLLLSPLGGADAVSLRRLRRELRRAEMHDGGGRAGGELLAAAVVDPFAAARAGPDGGALRRLAAAVRAGVTAAAAAPAGPGWAVGVTAETVLWEIWSALGLARRWREEALRGGATAVRADRDLDAVVALFDAAARFVERLPTAGPDLFLDHVRGEDVPGDTLVARAPTAGSVALLTPAAAAGRQWPLVVVAGVQEGVWPDLRLRGSLLGSADLVDLHTGREGSVRAKQAAVRYDETRLFHVAVTRATERLLVTAVRSEDEQPSPYLDLVDPLPAHQPHREFAAVRPRLTLPDLVGALRRGVLSRDPLERRRCARHLARLADDGAPGADPDQWWALVEHADPRPRRGPGQPVRVSPSTLAAFATCPLRWVLTASGGDGVPSPSAGIGSLVHAVAAEVGDADAATLREQVDLRWAQLGLPRGWATDRLRAEAHRMAGRLADYVAAAPGRGWHRVGVELDIEIPLGRAVLRGRVDRLERHTDDGRLRVVDYKTGSSKPTKAELPRHPQLGAYQLAVVEGAFAEAGRHSAGAALVQLGKAAASTVSEQLQPPLADDDEPTWARDLVEHTAEGMAAATFPARPGKDCDRCPVRASCPAHPEGRAL